MFPTTAGKWCVPDVTKGAVDLYQTVQSKGSKQYVGMGGAWTVNAVCTDSRILQVAGLLSAATLVASSQLV